MTTPQWVGRFARVDDLGSPGQGPEGRGDHGRPRVCVNHHYGKPNHDLTELG
jgi:hypothetical protein